MTPELGALVEPAAVAFHAAGRAGDIAGLRVLVLGAGPIGNLVAQVARWQRACSVVITDISDYRLEIARRCGIGRAIHAHSEAFDERIRSEFDGSGPDVTFECVGLEETANQVIRLARKGSTIVVTGVFGDCPKIDLGLVQDRELHLIGTLMYQRKDYAEAIRCLANSGVITQPLLTVSFPFDQYLRAYRYIDECRDRVMKVMIDLDRPGEARPTGN